MFDKGEVYMVDFENGNRIRNAKRNRWQGSCRLVAGSWGFDVAYTSGIASPVVQDRTGLESRMVETRSRQHDALICLKNKSGERA